MSIPPPPHVPELSPSRNDGGGANTTPQGENDVLLELLLDMQSQSRSQQLDFEKQLQDALNEKKELHLQLESEREEHKKDMAAILVVQDSLRADLRALMARGVPSTPFTL